jgi:hypothetical protein
MGSLVPATATYDMTVNQGDTFHFQGTWLDKNRDPIDTTSMTARMQVRTSTDATDFVLELTTEDGGISFDGGGVFTLIVSADDMAAVAPASYKYDLEVVNGGDVRKLLRGKFKVLAEVTK